jgi:shikimate dehydrogenase
MTLPSRVLVGLIGANITKSLSPWLHEDALAAAGLSGHYHLMDVDRLKGRTLESLIDGVRTTGFAGVNVTYPFKQAVIPLLDELTAEARQIGAVNTVAFSPSGRTLGDNTDRSGFRQSFLETLGKSCISGRPVVLVGAGGAGRAVAFALLDLGASRVDVFDADTKKSSALAHDLIAHVGASCARAIPDLAPAAREAAGIVNATPVGMLGIPGNPVPPAVIESRHVVADVIYTPIETELIKVARDKGCRVLTGDGMCVHQAADAFVRFTGLKPNLQRMHQTFRRALLARDAALAEVA